MCVRAGKCNKMYFAATRQPHIYVDLDGVLSDFDRAAVALLGCYGWKYEAQHGAKAFWDRIHGADEFFYNLPLLPDARELWDYCCSVGEPTVLTGVPKNPTAADQKRRWVQQHFGHDRVITCASRDKCKHGRPGDILVDDWDRYRHLWQEMGGTFVLHTCAVDSIRQLKELL